MAGKAEAFKKSFSTVTDEVKAWVFLFARFIAVLVVAALGLSIFELQHFSAQGYSIPYPWVRGSWEQQVAFVAALYFSR